MFACTKIHLSIGKLICKEIEIISRKIKKLG